MTARSKAMSRDNEKKGRLRQLSVTQEELDLLLKVCKRHRSAMPLYLQSAKHELDVVDGIIRKLS
jgi:hypothetical protein